MGNYSHSNLEYKVLDFTSYFDTHSYNNTQYDTLVNETEVLNDEIDSLKAAKPILINLERINFNKTEYYSGSAITDYSVTLEWT